MALLFIYDRSKDHFSEMFGVTHEEWIGMHERLFDMVVEDIDLNFNDEENETSIVQSRLEYAQALAEYLKRDLTPELGLLIGYVLAEAGKMTEKIMALKGMGKNKQSE